MCRDGCINGPASGRETTSRFRGRLQVERYAHETTEAYPALLDEVPLAETLFLTIPSRRTCPMRQPFGPSWRKIGKNGPEDELNCGSWWLSDLPG